eukprot:5337964-Ditylum_brightwellii.AAC.1
MKEECAKTKKDLEDGKGYGYDKGCNLDSNMISTCNCPGCTGKKIIRWQSQRSAFDIRSLLVLQLPRQEKQLTN